MEAPGNEPFEARADAPALGDLEIHVWLLGAHAAATPRAIATEARVALGNLLRAYANTPHVPVIERNPHGKPFAPGLPQLHFNASHAGAHILLAFARGQELGIDIEQRTRPVSVDDIAQRFFTPREAQALHSVAPAQKAVAFLRLWTHKEAVLKALGLGLGFGLEHVEFALDAHGGIAGLAQIAATAGDRADWRVHPLHPTPDLIGALAWRGPPRSVRTFRLLQ